jgi:hypothetical protein
VVPPFYLFELLGIYYCLANEKFHALLVSVDKQRPEAKRSLSCVVCLAYQSLSETTFTKCLEGLENVPHKGN